MASTSRFAVAVHIMVDLSSCGVTQVKSSSALAKRLNTNAVVVRRLVGRLQEAGLVRTRPGKLGGARLAKSASEISLWDVYEATEESNLFLYNPNPPDKKCIISCAMKEALSSVFNSTLWALRKELDRHRLDKLVLRCQIIGRRKRRLS